MIQALTERKGETRLADAGLAGEQHDLTFASSGPLEPLEQKPDFVFATDEWGELMPVKSLEAALGLASRRRHAKHGSADKALQVARAEIDELEQSAKQLCVSSATTIAAGFGQRLQPCGQVRCLTDNRLLPALNLRPQDRPRRRCPWRCQPAAFSGAFADVVSFATASTIANPARTARSASSSWPLGQPK